MSEELPIVIVLSVIPGWFLKPSHEPTLTPGTAAGLVPPLGLLPPLPPVAPVLVVQVPVPVVVAAPVAVPLGASTAVPVSPVDVPVSPDVPVVSVPAPEPRLPETARLAASTSLGLSSDPPHAARMNSA